MLYFFLDRQARPERENAIMAQVLLFNIRGDKLRRIRTLSFKLGLRCVSVEPEDFSKTLGALCGRADEAADNGGDEAPVFGGEMLVMDELTPAQFHGLLDALRRGCTASCRPSMRRWKSSRERASTAHKKYYA